MCHRWIHYRLHEDVWIRHTPHNINAVSLRCFAHRAEELMRQIGLAQQLEMTARIRWCGVSNECLVQVVNLDRAQTPCRIAGEDMIPHCLVNRHVRAVRCRRGHPAW